MRERAEGTGRSAFPRCTRPLIGRAVVAEALCSRPSPRGQGPGKVVQWDKRLGARTVVTHKHWWWAPDLT